MTKLKLLSALFLCGLVLHAYGAGPNGGEDEQPQPDQQFTGWQACAECHQPETDAWKSSTHAKHATPVAQPEGGADGAIGSHWMQAFIRKDKNGYHRIVPTCFDLREKQWRQVAEVLIEIMGGSPKEVPAHHVQLDRRSFELDCSGCHASQAQLRIDPQTGRMDSRWVDLAINCETCHGPGRAHVLAWQGLDHWSPGLPQLEKFGPRAATAVCARCHGGPPAAHDFGPQDAAAYVGDLEDQSGLFPDGTAKGQVYQYTTFMRSPCFIEGGLTCTDCHDAHGPGLRNQEHPDAFCTRCHQGLSGRQHTFHDPEKEGGRCVACHMPKVLDGLMEHQRDHRIGIPLPASPLVPDACTSCHKDKTKQWADRAYRECWGAPSQQTLDAVNAIHLARRRDPKAEPLLRRALSHPDPFFRANAALYLRDPTGLRADPVPEVRLIAVRAAAQGSNSTWLKNALHDREPIVRAQAALGLMVVQKRGLGLDGSIHRENPFGDLIDDLDVVVKLRRQHYFAHWMLGHQSLRDGEPQRARELFERILPFQPYNPDAWLALAFALDKSDRNPEAQAARQRALLAFTRAQKPKRARVVLKTLIQEAASVDERKQLQAMLRRLNAYYSGGHR